MLNELSKMKLISGNKSYYLREFQYKFAEDLYENEESESLQDLHDQIRTYYH